MIDKPGCLEALKEVERLLDGELEAELRIKVEKHLSGCSPCMDRAEFRRHLKVMIAAKCTGDTPPAELLIRVRTIIEERDVAPS